MAICSISFSLISEIHEKVDLIFGIKNIFELEGTKNPQESCFSISNRLISFFAKEQIVLNRKLIKIEAPIVYEISGLALHLGLNILSSLIWSFHIHQGFSLPSNITN